MLTKSKWIDAAAKALAQWNANKLQGSTLSAAAPAADNILYYNATAAQWEPRSLDDANNPANGWTLRDDFLLSLSSFTGLIGDLNWVTAVTGGSVANTAATVDGNNPGVARVTAGAMVAGAAGMILNNTAAIFKLGGGALYQEWLININTLSTATNDATIRLGIGDSSSADFTNGIYFQYTRATSLNWLIKTAAAATRTTAITSVPVTTGWVKLAALVNAAGTSVQFFINGVLAGTIATNIPTAALNFAAHQARVAGTPVGFDVDYFWTYQRFTTPR